MKTLLLLSSGSIITTLLPPLMAKPMSQVALAWVTTASKGTENTAYLEHHKQKMIAAHWNFEEIDIEGKSYDNLKKLFADKDVIYVEGGNTFYLLKAIKETGFDKVLIESIARGVTYVGSSAGSYIMCPTIEMSTWKSSTKSRFGLKDLTGLNQIPFLMVAHYDPKYDKALRKGIGKTKYPVKILTDDQALLIRGKKITLIGEGPEIILPV